MFFFLPALAVVAETAAVVTSGIIASVGPIGTAVATATTTIGGLAGTATAGVATTFGIEAATAGTISTIAAGSTTTALNVGIIETCKNLIV